MPTYEYRCKHCKHELEALQSMTAKPLTKCPQCGRNGLERVIGAGAGIIFRGPGFYATDYRRGSSAKGPSAKEKAKPGESKGEAASASEGSDSAD
jgi:putative FmdB family regulatory protein